MSKKTPKYYACLENRIYLFQYVDEFYERTKTFDICTQDEKFNFSWYSSLTLAVAFIFDIVAMLYAVLAQNTNLFVAFTMFAVFISPKLFNFIFKVFLYKFGNAAWRKSARMHAAIHMVMNAYEKYQRIPTIEEAKEASYYTNDCKSFSKEISLLTYSCVFLVVALFHFNTIACVIASIVISVFFNLFRSCFVFLEHLILSKPEESDLIYVINQIKSIDTFID